MSKPIPIHFAFWRLEPGVLAYYSIACNDNLQVAMVASTANETLVTCKACLRTRAYKGCCL